MAEPLPTGIWAHPHRLSRHALQELLAAAGLDAQTLPWDPLGLRLDADSDVARHWGYFAGLFQIQEEAARLPVALLDPHPGERVLDLCAAPGNKTAQIALAMDNQGLVVANELQSRRLPPLRQTVRRLGLLNVLTVRGPGEALALQTGPFDRVLVDAPCSGEGTWRRLSAERRARAAAETPAREPLAQRQLRLLERAVRLCRPGGRIVYSTCTLAPEENEAVVDALLTRADGAVAVETARVSGLAVQPGLTHWEGQSYDPQVAKCLRLWPGMTDTGGFFVAVLKKAGHQPADSDGERAELGRDGLSHPATGVLQTRFGIDDIHLAGLVISGDGGRYLHYASAGQPWNGRPIPDAHGLAVAGLQMRPVKPTTALALWLGTRAARNRIALSAEAAADYLQRRPVPAGGFQPATELDGPGWVVVSHAGHSLGVARLTRSGELESLFPKAWVRDQLLGLPV